MQERNICSQGITAFLWLTFTKFSLLCSKRSSGRTRLTTAISFHWDNQSWCIHSDLLQYLPYFFRERKLKYLHLLPLLSSSILLFTLMSGDVLSYPWVFFDPRCVAPPLIHCTIYASICSPYCKKIGEKNVWINKYLFTHVISLSLSLMMLFTTVQKCTPTNNNNHHHKKKLYIKVQ